MTMKIQTLTKEEQRLISFLPAGAERPRSQSELAALLYGNASNENKDERLAALQTLRTQSSSLIKRADKLRRTALWTN